MDEFDEFSEQGEAGAMAEAHVRDYVAWRLHFLAPFSRDDYEAAARRCFPRPDMARLLHAHTRVVRPNTHGGAAAAPPALESPRTAWTTSGMPPLEPSTCCSFGCCSFGCCSFGCYRPPRWHDFFSTNRHRESTDYLDTPGVGDTDVTPMKVLSV